MPQQSRTGLNALYYPFSRATDVESLKQQLLLFDTISFIDPVDSEEWRAKLFRDLETEQGRNLKQKQIFQAYRRFARELPGLIRSEIIKIHNPNVISSINDPEVTASILSDLSDSNWTRAASRPDAFGLPFLADKRSGQPTWQIFFPKMPTQFVETLTSERKLRRHLIQTGDELKAWSLSYAAGSAVALNTHLAAAEVLNCVPLTDSEMHHRLLLRKIARSAEQKVDLDHPSRRVGIRELTAKLNIMLVKSLMPTETLAKLSIDDILRFRDSTATIRGDFVDCTGRMVRSRLDGISDAAKLEIGLSDLAHEIRQQLDDYGNELMSIRDNLWPKLLSNRNIISVAPVLVAALFMGAQFTLGASIIPTISIVQTVLERRRQRRIVERRASPALTYLAQVKTLK